MVNLQDELCFYKFYHNNPTNVRIHMTFIPIILLTSLVFLGYLQVPAAVLPEACRGLLLQYLPYLNAGTLLAVTFSVIYCTLDIVGFAVAPLLVGFSVASRYVVVNKLGPMNNNPVTQEQVLLGALLLHGSSWIAQFIGHGAYEKRKPALLDSLFQALVLAPFFVVFEIAFALGFRKDLEIRLHNQVTRMISEDRRKSLQKQP